jgi:RNA polymerase sigma-70 factor (ECF subfamily)
MTTLVMALAIRPQIRDNTSHAELEFLWEVAGSMSRGDGQHRVWGTEDKGRLADLISRSRGGDLGAAESLYGIFKQPIFNLAYRHTLNQATAEDLLQDIFLKVFTNLGSVRDVETFPAWVYRIALNTCYSHLRQKRAASEKSVPLDELEGRLENESSEPVESDLRGPLDEAIRDLPNRLRSVFVLHDVEGYKHHEISRILGCSVGTSKSQLFKARLKLRNVLKAKAIV